MAKDDWWIKFEIHKWLNDPKVRRLSRANRDSWLTSIMMMRLEGSDRISGTQADLSNMLSLSLAEFFDFFHDLERTGTADVERVSDDVTHCPEIFTIISRRLQKELKAKESSRLRKQRERCHADVTPMSQDRVISNKKEVTEDTNVSSERADAPAVFSHPALVAIRQITKTSPPKPIWPRLCDRIGPTPDTVRLRSCFVEWVARGFKEKNYAWAEEWYVTGIPEKVNQNGTNTKFNTSGNKPSPGEIIANRSYRRDPA